MPRTSHIHQISALREVAVNFDRLHAYVGRQQYKADAVSARAVADLLEMHDATSLNLYNAPGLLEFVQVVGSQMIGEFLVQPNNA